MSISLSEFNFSLFTKSPPSSVRLPLAVSSYGLSDKGRVRPGNEDCFLIANFRAQPACSVSAKTTFGTEAAHLLIVADGMGGHRGGKYASNLAAVTAEAFLRNAFNELSASGKLEESHLLQQLRAALRATNERVLQEASQRPDLHGMGTTLTAALIYQSDLYIAHVGDSRCYLFRERELEQVTHDHTMVAEMMRHGYGSAKESAAFKHLRHVLTNSVGGPKTELTVETHKIPLQVGDWLLLCSDGLTEMLPEEKITKILWSVNDPRHGCEQLIQEANQAGGVDNITALLAQVLSAPWCESSASREAG